MLKATKDLLSLLSLNKKVHFQTRNNYIYLINRFGTIEDAEALADFYIKHPSDDPDLEDLLEPIRLHGNLEIAEKLFAACFAQNRIKEGYNRELVHCLGALGYEPIVPVVMPWWEEDEYSWDHDVVLGLLHFSCQGYEDKIYRAIQSCMGRHLFPEMIPALSCKVPDDTLPQQIYQLGIHCSTDSNTGIVLGIALYGEQERERFESILWDERFEAHLGSTGTIFGTYLGLQYLQITFRELFEKIKDAWKQGISKEDLSYRCSVLRSLLERKLRFDPIYPLKFGKPKKESFADLYHSLFEGYNENDNVICFVGEHLGWDDDLRSDFQELENLLEIRMEQEMMLQYLAPAE